MYSDRLNPFALQNGELITVDQVSPGLACNCTCPHCHEPVVAKKGPQNIHHFSHYKKSSCIGSFETALHLKGKTIFQEHDSFVVPLVKGQLCRYEWKFTPRSVHFNEDFGGWKRRPIPPINKLSYQSVFIETKIGKIRPDIVLFTDIGPVIIEIYVTHKTPIHKIDEIKKLSLPAIEIDLRSLLRSNFLDNSIIENSLIHDQYNKTWLNEV